LHHLPEHINNLYLRLLHLRNAVFFTSREDQNHLCVLCTAAQPWCVLLALKRPRAGSDGKMLANKSC